MSDWFGSLKRAASVVADKASAAAEQAAVKVDELHTEVKQKGLKTVASEIAVTAKGQAAVLADSASELADAAMGKVSQWAVTAEQALADRMAQPPPFRPPTVAADDLRYTIAEEQFCAEVSHFVYDHDAAVGDVLSFADGTLSATVIATFLRKDQRSWVLQVSQLNALFIVFRGTGTVEILMCPLKWINSIILFIF
jgi:hypothetical protein